MLKRFLLAFGAILLYMVAWLPIVLFLVLVIADGEEEIALLLVMVLFFLIAGALLPYMNFISRYLFHFRGKGKALSESALRQRILQLNELNAPVMVKEHKRKLIVTWNYVDATWWGILSKAGLEKMYELQIKFNDRKKEATLIDVKKSVSWRAGPTSVRLSGGYFRGIDLSYEVGKAWGIRQEFELGKVYDYQFKTSEIKDPVIQTILQSGWDVRFAMW